jgi:EmrB/QacA subfamily drug resistance transporter
MNAARRSEHRSGFIIPLPAGGGKGRLVGRLPDFAPPLSPATLSLDLVTGIVPTMGFRLSSPLDPKAAGSVRSGHVLLSNSLVAWVTAFMTTAINVALPSIQEEFHLGAVAYGWLPLGYMLTSAMFILPFAKLGDRFGRRLLFLIGLIVFAVSSTILVFASSYTPLLVLRLTQGLGASMMFSTSMAMVTVAYPPQRRGLAMGVSVGAAYLGMTLGPALGGIMVHHVGWRSLFILSACFAVVNLGLDVWLLGRAEWKEERAVGSDWTGSLVYAAGLAAFLSGLSWLPLLKGAILVVLGTCALAFFVWWESRVRNPVVEVRLFRRYRVFALSNLAALVSYASVWAQSFLLSLYLQSIRGLNPETAGWVLITGVALQCLVSPFGGRLSDRIEPRWVASGGMLLCVAGLLMLSFLQTDTPYWYIILALCLLGLGYGFFSGPNQSSIMGSVDKRYVGFASGSISTVRTIGMSVSVAGATMVMALVVGRHDITPADYPNLLTAVRTAFAVYTALSAVAVLVSLVRGRMPVHEQPAESTTPSVD